MEQRGPKSDLSHVGDKREVLLVKFLSAEGQQALKKKKIKKKAEVRLSPMEHYAYNRKPESKLPKICHGGKNIWVMLWGLFLSVMMIFFYRYLRLSLQQL